MGKRKRSKKRSVQDGKKKKVVHKKRHPLFVIEDDIQKNCSYPDCRTLIIKLEDPEAAEGHKVFNASGLWKNVNYFIYNEAIFDFPPEKGATLILLEHMNWTRIPKVKIFDISLHFIIPLQEDSNFDCCFPVDLEVASLPINLETLRIEITFHVVNHFEKKDNLKGIIEIPSVNIQLPKNYKSNTLKTFEHSYFALTDYEVENVFDDESTEPWEIEFEHPLKFSPNLRELFPMADIGDTSLTRLHAEFVPESEYEAMESE